MKGDEKLWFFKNNFLIEMEVIMQYLFPPIFYAVT